MNIVEAERTRNSVPSCRNETLRQRAIEQLDLMLANVDGVAGAFGEITLTVPYNNGQFFDFQSIDKKDHRVSK
jgi:hypothetical protein